jgi:hypothetical protein
MEGETLAHALFQMKSPPPSSSSSSEEDEEDEFERVPAPT